MASSSVTCHHAAERGREQVRGNNESKESKAAYAMKEHTSPEIPEQT